MKVWDSLVQICSRHVRALVLKAENAHVIASASGALAG